MVAAPVQCDVDGITKGLHPESLPRSCSARRQDEARSYTGASLRSADAAPQDDAGLPRAVGQENLVVVPLVPAHTSPASSRSDHGYYYFVFCQAMTKK
jgi:hypothetical protein